MNVKNPDLDRNDKPDVKKDSIWTKIAMHEFGSKCIMAKHDLCHDLKCKCLCHQKKEE
jgi:hypothetical protein